MTDPATVWALSDGVAGNRRQALALAQALARPPGGEAGAVREMVLYPRAPWRWLAPRRAPGAERAFGEAFAALLASPPALAVGCGRQAALATRLLRERGAKAVQILDPRLPARHWDALVVPAHDGLCGENVVAMLGSVHPIDADWLARARLAHIGLSVLPAPRTALLLGGPVRNAALDRHWWAQVAPILEHWLAREGGSLLVCGSRRTPAWLARAVRARFGAAPGLRWFDAGDGANPYPGVLAWADRIVVSPDSVNMLSEACATAAPVFVHHRHPSRGRHGRFHRALLEAGRVRPLKLAAPEWDIVPLHELPQVAGWLRGLLGL